MTSSDPEGAGHDEPIFGLSRTHIRTVWLAAINLGVVSHMRRGMLLGDSASPRIQRRRVFGAAKLYQISLRTSKSTWKVGEGRSLYAHQILNGLGRHSEGPP